MHARGEGNLLTSLTRCLMLPSAPSSTDGVSVIAAAPALSIRRCPALTGVFAGTSLRTPDIRGGLHELVQRFVTPSWLQTAAQAREGVGGRYCAARSRTRRLP